MSNAKKVLLISIVLIGLLLGWYVYRIQSDNQYIETIMRQD
jgi:hypothetical protein